MIAVDEPLLEEHADERDEDQGDGDDAEVVRPEHGCEQERERPSTSRDGPSS